MTAQGSLYFLNFMSYNTFHRRS